MEESTATELDSSSLSILMGKLGQVLIQMESIEMGSFPALKQAFSLLETEFNDAKHLIENHSSPDKHEDLLQKLGRSLELVLLSSREATIVNKETMEVLCKEIMAMKLDLSSSSSGWYENDTTDEIEEEEEEEVIEIEVEEVGIATIDDAILQIKSGNGENLKNALALLNEMMMDGMISDEP